MLAATLLVLAPAGGADAEGRLTVHDTPRPLPDITFTGRDGMTYGLADYRSQVVVLNIWATWCLPCIRELPSLSALQADLGEAGVQVLPLAVDRMGVPAAAGFFAKEGITNLPALAAPGTAVVKALGEDGLPLTVVIDKAGREAARVLGPAEWNSGRYRALVEALAKAAL